MAHTRHLRRNGRANLKDGQALFTVQACAIAQEKFWKCWWDRDFWTDARTQVPVGIRSLNDLDGEELLSAVKFGTQWFSDFEDSVYWRQTISSEYIDECFKSSCQQRGHDALDHATIGQLVFPHWSRLKCPKGLSVCAQVYQALIRVSNLSDHYKSQTALCCRLHLREIASRFNNR